MILLDQGFCFKNSYSFISYNHECCMSSIHQLKAIAHYQKRRKILPMARNTFKTKLPDNIKQ